MINLGKICKVLPRGAALALLALTFVAQLAGAVTYDALVGGSLRTYALSGVVEAEIGLDFKLWGDPASPMHGYLRPRFYASTALTYSSVDLALEVFPLAFMGLRLGDEVSQNDHDYSAYDCTSAVCRGRFNRAYAEAEISLGAGPIFAQWRGRRERWREDHPDRGDFIDPTSGLILNHLGGSQTVQYAVVGAKLNPMWSLIAALRFAVSDDRGISRLPFVGARFNKNGLGVTVGAGTFESPLKKREPTALFVLRWEFQPSLALH